MYRKGESERGREKKRETERKNVVVISLMYHLWYKKNKIK